MLILTRRIGETLMVGDEVTVTVLGVKGNQVRIGVNAPKDIAVHREEIYQRIQREKQNHDLIPIPAQRRGAARLGAPDPARRNAALFDYVSHPVGAWPAQGRGFLTQFEPGEAFGEPARGGRTASTTS